MSAFGGDENVAPQQNKQKSAGGSKASKGKTIEETYTKKTQLEHILLRPDTYIGSVEKQIQLMWVFDAETRHLVNRNCAHVPGLYKIFDEIIVNAADNKQRDPTMTRIEVTINPDNNSIRVWNNGNGIPIVVHQEEKIYIPELIFGHLLTGSNFDDNESKTTGGRNGYGAKLANIFSKEFVVETADKSRGLKFKQTYRNNMGTRTEPEITKFSGTDFTCITFYPDLEKFKMDSLDEDIVALLSKRVYDIAATNNASGGKLKVFLNGTEVQTRSFEAYIGICTGLETPCAFERISDRWEVGVSVSDGTFQQVSFVNSIATIKGGTHVNYITDQITNKLMAVVKKRNKGQEVKPGQIKNHLAVYVNALVVNPAFDSQTKENLTTKSSAFGSTCTLSDKFLKNIEKSNIIDNILDWSKFKQNAELKKKGGTKRSKLTGITKLDDANNAGTAKSRDCTLILTEGDSAKALAISGLGVVGRDYYGVFPLKGKLLNVREAMHAQIMKNEEIQNIAKILGLTFGKVYEDASQLRYGHLMIMADQDHDGSHIKGLLINFLHHFWPSLLRIEGFLKQFITPIVKCSKGKKEQTFFTIPQYMNWREDNTEGKGWKIKYYKGLGTSTSAEAKDYFSNLETHEIDFMWDDRANDMIDMAFAKKRVDDRKLWLLALEPGCHINYDVDRISYDDFINKELILFSHADNERSLPHFMDGLKPSQRKVLFACFKRNLKQEIKVAQLAGYISEHSAYHHGEASLTQTIIGMAQNFVGSNNINLLSPCGQFGTRLMGGKDAASPRYVFTKLETITRCIFHPHDDPLLNYLDDDGQSIEPTCYVPVIPMALVNGSDGIGTGWSTNVPTYNPREIIDNLRLMIAGEEPLPMDPWYRGFKGEIKAKTGKDSHNYQCSGGYEVVDDQTIIINELPVGRWTTDYKQMLETMMVGAAPVAKEDNAFGGAVSLIVKDFKENHTDTTVLFTVTITQGEIEKCGDTLQKKFKLDGSIATTNMMMFDMNGMIRKFENPLEIMQQFYDVRVEYYGKRKVYLMNTLTESWEKLDNKVRFILRVITGELVVSNRKKIELLSELQSTGFKLFAEKKSVAKKDAELEEGGDGMDDGDDSAVPVGTVSLDRGYDYLLSMKIWSLTMEKVKALTAERDEKRRELDYLAGKTAEDLWLEDLDALEEALQGFEGEIVLAEKQEAAARKKAQGSKAARSRGGGGKIKGASSKGRGNKGDSDEESEDNDSDFDDEPKKKAKPVVKQIKPKPVVSSSASAPTTQSEAVTNVTKPEVKAKASTSSAKASTTLVAPAKKASAAPIIPKAKEIEAPAPQAPAPPLDLKARLLAKMAAAAQAAGGSAPTTGGSASSSSSVPTAVVAKPVKLVQSKLNLTKSKPTATLDLCESDDDSVDIKALSSLSLNNAASSAPSRASRPVSKISYKDDDDEEDEDLVSSSEDDEPKKKAAPVKPKAAVKKAVSAVAAVPASKNVGVKRPKKTSGESEERRVMEVYSPGMTSPEAIKKPRKNISAPSVSAAGAALKAASKAKPVIPTSKVVKSNKKIVESDDEDEDEEEEEEEVQAGPRTPKPTRQRAAVKSYVQSESEESEEEEEEESDYESS